MKAVGVVFLAAWLTACEADPTVLELSGWRDPSLPPGVPTSAFTVRGTVYQGAQALSGADAWVELFFESSGAPVYLMKRPADRDTGAWDVPGWGNLCSNASTHRVRVKYVVAPDTLQTSLQPVWANPPLTCSGTLVADDIVIPE